jgi:tetratricopeptide (TPR) repeat protein
MTTDATLRPEDRSLVTCPKCGGKTAIVLRESSNGPVKCTHCTAVIDKGLLALGMGPGAQSSMSESPTNIVANMPFGRYQLLRELGRGGMGIVWLAQDPSLGRQVALKLLSGAGPEDIARFEREARTAASLSHPNIAPVYEVGVQDGRPYLAMQFIAGKTLDQTLGDKRPAPRRSAEIIRDAARAVHHAHENGVIHRDLKPQNIMLQPEGDASRIYVLDFGLARRTDVASSISMSGVVVGTPAFMSPEQAAGAADLDARSDVYGLGATLYAMVTGKPPYEGGTPIDIIFKVAHTDPPSPKKYTPTLHADLETIIMTAMAREKERRYATAAAFADDLQRFLDNEAIQARPASIMYRLSRRVRKHPAWITAGLAAVVALALGVTLLAGGAREKAKRAATLVQAELAFSSKRWEVAKTHYAELNEHDPQPAYSDRMRECDAMIAKEAEERAVAQRRLSIADRAKHVGERLDDAVEHFEQMRFDASRTWAIVESSLKEADKLVAEDGKVAEALVQRARARRLLHQRTAARVDIDRAIELDPSHRPARIERIRVILDQVTVMMAGRSTGDAGTWAEFQGSIETAERDREAVRGDTGLLPPKSERDLEVLATLKAFVDGHEEEAAVVRLASITGQDAEAWYWLSVFQESNRQPEAALKSIQKALELRPDFSKARWHHGTMLAKLGQTQPALAEYTEACRLDPYDAYPLLNRAISLYRMGKTDEAWPAIRRVLDLDPDIVKAWELAVKVAVARNELNEARIAADRCIELHPSRPEGYDARARYHEAKGEHAAMLPYLKKAIDRTADRDPMRPYLECTFAMALIKTGRVSDALARADECIRVAPKHARGWYWRGAALHQLGRLEESVKAFEESLRLHESEDAWTGLGISCLELGDREAAIRHFTKSIELAPKDTQARVLRGEVYRQLQRYQDAVDDLTVALDLSPESVDALVNRGMCYIQLGKIEASLKDLDAAIARDPKNQYARYYRAAYHVDRKEYREALKHVEAALGTATTTRELLEHLREVCKEALGE